MKIHRARSVQYEPAGDTLRVFVDDFAQPASSMVDATLHLDAAGSLVAAELAGDLDPVVVALGPREAVLRSVPARVLRMEQGALLITMGAKRVRGDVPNPYVPWSRYPDPPGPAPVAAMNMDPHAIAQLVGDETVITPTEGLPSDPEILKLASRLGVVFPRDYVQFLRSCGSLLVQVRPELWPPPKPGDVAPNWMQTRFALRVFGVCSEVEWMRIEPETAVFREETGTDLAPVFQWPNALYTTCFDPNGRLVHWSADGVTPVADTFAQHLERLLLEQRSYRDRLLGRHP